MTIEEKMEIYDDLKVKKDYHENICTRYQIGHESIKSFLKNLKKDPNHLRKLFEKDKTKTHKEGLLLE